jgi:hypothetical protein
MDAGLSPRQTRAKHRHELRTLTYVTLDQANGGIVRNLNQEGIGVQAVAAVRPGQLVRVRFELRYPRVRVEARGEVTWATSSGQCGILFLDLSPRMTRRLNEWIFGDLLEGLSPHAERDGSIFADRAWAMRGTEQDDGLMVSAAPLKVIELPVRPDPLRALQAYDDEASTARQPSTQLDWLSQPLSGRSLSWTVDTLVVVAALLLFALVFLSVTRESPRWPLAMTGGAAVVVALLYWGFFQLFGGGSPGARLARLAGCDLEDDEGATSARFR